MDVDETGQQCPIAEFDNSHSLRVFDMGIDSTDPVAFNEHFAWLQNVARVDLKQASCMQHDRGRGLLR